ncbi:OLC1v1031399C1 [Oldenlandia corymbosa var. corymbosa]|uniref:OLC1v1031399C1 n=1 Tax=Oldenlandia corymbosa var. corymbosa TaxID=529605 RepID=A0AAV1CKB9_OLDCO|nr:OLC1v1031399C1 [Oldenlandia corymbosa var. corymbosa]
MEDNVVHDIKNIGVSLLVENVQQLASKALKEIPHRYIRPEIRTDEVSVNESSQIPVIDMSKLGTGNVGYQTEMSKLHQACKEWGFFQLTNHGAATEIENMKAATQEFFMLPLEEKMVYAQQPDNLEGYGQAFVMSEDQKLDWSDMFFIYCLPESSRNLKFWPTNPASFRSSLEEYSRELHKVCSSLCELMATNLGVDEFSGMYKELIQSIRLNYYPPCSQPDKVIGLSPHSDINLLTLLVQSDEVEGLQIRKNGKWIPIKPIPEAIVVNVGDTMEIMSNGLYESIEHRAVVNSHKARLSLAAFHGPSGEANIGPLPDLVKENGAKFKTVNYEEFLKIYLGRTLDGKSMLDYVRI